MALMPWYINMSLDIMINKCFREFLGIIFYLWYCLFGKQENILSLYFHNPSESLFEKIIQSLYKMGYRFVSLDEFISELSSPIEMKTQGRIAFVSFDDGWRNNLKLIPIMEKYHVPMTLFVSTEPIQSGNYWWEYPLAYRGLNYVNSLKKLSRKDFLTEVARCKILVDIERSAITEDELYRFAQHPLVDIQSHTHTHPILTICPPDILEYELVYSRSYLETFLHKPVKVFSYPNGSFSQDVIDGVKKAGYKYAFTTEATSIEDWDGDWLRIPRRSINDGGGLYENMSKVFGVWQRVFK